MCREEAAEVRGHVDEIEKKGAKLAFVGSGSPAQAKNFAEHLKVPASVSLFTDPTLESFRAAGLRRSMFRTLGLQSLRNFFRARKKGFKQGRVQGDPWQQGGSLVVDTSGHVRYRFVSNAPGDHPPPATLLQHL